MLTPLLLGARLPEKAKVAAVGVLLGTFARVFDVEPPRVTGLSHRAALAAFREFSAACMEAALVSPSYAVQKRVELEKSARKLGGRVRSLLRPRDDELVGLVAYLYRIIEIEVEGALPGRLHFKRCFFSDRYTPQLCAFMSAFDSGFVGGLAGGPDSRGSLAFEARITEGAPCCMAVFTPAV